MINEVHNRRTFLKMSFWIALGCSYPWISEYIIPKYIYARLVPSYFEDALKFICEFDELHKFSEMGCSQVRIEHGDKSYYLYGTYTQNRETFYFIMRVDPRRFIYDENWRLMLTADIVLFTIRKRIIYT